MLDIYFFPDSRGEMPDEPLDLVHAGSLDLWEHRLLEPSFAKCERLGLKFGYFDDSHLNSREIRKVFDIFENDRKCYAKNPSLQVYTKFLDILFRSKADHFGLIAFCD
jgi:hypothetical protein